MSSSSVLFIRPTITEIVPTGSKCLPGQTVVELQGDVTVIAGKGLQVVEQQQQNNNNNNNGKTKLIATVAGTLRKSMTEIDTPSTGNDPSNNNNTKQIIHQYEVSSSMRKYFPEVGDFVIGTIVKQIGGANGQYQVHIGSAHLAVLDPTAFDGASKHSKPRLLPGDLVYAHVARADPDLDVVLSCCSLPHMDRKDWVTGEGTFGPLSNSGSAMVRVSLPFAKKLISNESLVLAMLGKRTSFEAAVGVNGVVWISNLTSFVKNSIAAKNNQNQNQPTSQSAKAAAAVNALTPEEVKKQVYALVALCQCVLGSEDDHTQTETQSRVDRYFPTVMVM